MTIKLFLLLLMCGTAFAAPSKKTYNKKEIALARFGSKERQDLIKKVYFLKSKISQSVVGQDHLAQAAQDRIVYWLENFGARDGEPAALHTIGFGGGGKSAIFRAIEKLGLPVFYIDAQKFAGGEKAEGLAYRIYNTLRTAHRKNGEGKKPYILILDEIDKTPEIRADRTEETQPLIGMLNEILTSGKLDAPYSGGERIDFSNVLVMTAMNFSQDVIEKFSQEVLGSPKSFWDYDEADMEKLDRRLKEEGVADAAVAKILASIFRPNTIGRLLPDLLTAKPLYGDDFDKIVKLNIDAAVKRSSEGISAAKRLSVSYSDRYAAYLRTRTVYSPIGARKAVKNADMLTQQLINFAARVTLGPIENDTSFNRPRSVHLDAKPGSDKVTVYVTSQIKRGKDLRSEKTFKFDVGYDSRTKSFSPTHDVRLEVSPKDIAVEKREKPVTKAEIRKARGRTVQAEVKGLAEKLKQQIFGQDGVAEILENDLTEYLSQTVKPEKPLFRILAGFTGTGKTSSAVLAAEELGLPVVKINLQEFSSEDDEAAQRFIQDLVKRLETARAERPDHKYLLLIEELDKTNEVDPSDGKFITRPIMGLIKDLLNEGTKETAIGKEWDTKELNADINDGYTVVTLNLPLNKYHIEADPNATTHEDMMDIYDRLTTSVEELRSNLTTIFRIETVDRLLSPRFMVVKPLEEEHYTDILEKVANDVMNERFYNKKERNVMGIELKLSPSYKEYLLSESVIPSEQGRQASEAVRALLTNDITKAIRELAKRPGLASKPVKLTLHHLPAVNGRKPRTKSTADGQTLFSDVVALRFPKPGASGKISEDRLHTAVHEFGHAFTAAYLGLRFELATVVPPSDGTGGYVKPIGPDLETAKSMIADIYVSLGSRAMERIFMSKDPNSESSVLEITGGASSDIEMATKTLWQMIYLLGMNPQGGVIERSGLKDGEMHDYREYFFSALSDEKIQEMSLVLRDLEDALVRALLKAKPKSFFKEAILELARRGTVSEKEFYTIIGFPHPGKETVINTGENSAIQAQFAGSVELETPALRKARDFKVNGKTTFQRMTSAAKFFEKTLAKRLEVKLHASPCDKVVNQREK